MKSWLWELPVKFRNYMGCVLIYFDWIKLSILAGQFIQRVKISEPKIVMHKNLRVRKSKLSLAFFSVVPQTLTGSEYFKRKFPNTDSWVPHEIYKVTLFGVQSKNSHLKITCPGDSDVELVLRITGEALNSLTVINVLLKYPNKNIKGIIMCYTICCIKIYIFKRLFHTCFVFLQMQSEFTWKFPALHFILLPKAHSKNLCSDSSGVCSMELGELPDNKRKRNRLEEK